MPYMHFVCAVCGKELHQTAYAEVSWPKGLYACARCFFSQDAQKQKLLLDLGQGDLPPGFTQNILKKLNKSPKS